MRDKRGRFIKGYGYFSPEKRKEIGKKISFAKKGKVFSEEHKKKLSLAKLGKKRSEETKKKISKNNAKYWLGKKESAEMRERQSKAKIGKYMGENHWNWKGGYENQLILNHQYRARKRNAEGSHTLKEWNKLKKIYQFMCLCCKKVEPEIKLTEDHIVPLSKGGANYIWNIQPLCLGCNDRKLTKVIDYRKGVIIN